MSDSFEDQLATAFVAKMAGMTLKQVDASTVQQSSAGRATKIDPASFLTSIQQKKKQDQQRQAEEMNKLAEQMYPLPDPVQPLPPIEPLPAQNANQQKNDIPLPVASTEIVDILRSIDSSFKEFVEIYRKTHNVKRNNSK